MAKKQQINSNLTFKSQNQEQTNAKKRNRRSGEYEEL
jgi:hypothetical protein